MHLRVYALTVAVLFIACALCACETAQAYTNITVTYRLLPTTQTVNEQTGYIIREASAVSNISATQNIAGTAQATFAYQIWLCISNRTPSMLTADYVPFATRAAAGEGYQNASVSISENSLVAGISNLKVGVYVKFDDGKYLPVAYFVGDQLVERKINSATWTLTLYTMLVQNGSGSFASAVWGGSNSYSRLSGVEYTEALAQEKGLNLLASGEWILGLAFPYAAFIGYSIFWGVTMLFLGIMVYGRYRRYEPVIVMLLLYGGSGGLGLLIPEIGYRLIYSVVVFVITVILYRVFR